MTDCKFNTDSPPWTCQQCGFVHTLGGKPAMSDRPPRHNCPRESQKEAAKAREEAAKELRPAAEKLGIGMADVAHYASALARWAAAGFPVRSAEEVATIHAVCLACDQYVDGRCRQCGCRVNTSGMAVLNKIKMATEECPAAPWPN